jgi:DNA-binding response OmpR family regulator
MEKQRVLVVDDDREIANAIAINLRDEGYEVLIAYDGLQALDIVSSQNVHLIILDIMMPRMDGLSTTSEGTSGERTFPL